MAKIEKRLIKAVKQRQKNQFELIKPGAETFIAKIDVLRSSHGNGNMLVDQLLGIIASKWERGKFDGEMFDFYMEVAGVARKNAKANPRGIMLDAKHEDDFINPLVMQYFKESAGNRIKGIDETTMKYLRTALTKCYGEQANTKKWIDEIEKVVDCNYPRGRAEKIARTELAWAYNSGLLATHKEIGTRTLRWLAIMDSNTCPICRGYHDEVFNIDDLPQIPAHPSCRCTVVSADE